jgi:glucokinase
VTENRWAMGVDLGGTKVEVARVDTTGALIERLRRPTDVKDGASAVEEEVIAAVRELEERAGSSPAGVGVGVAGQIELDSGTVRFAPNLDWHDVPLQDDLSQALQLPVVVGRMAARRRPGMR